MSSKSASKFQVLSFTSMGHFVNDGNTWVLPVAYAYMVKVYDMPEYMAGVFGLIFFGLGALFSPVVGRLMDATGKPVRLIGLGTLLWALGLAVFGLGVKDYSVPLAVAGAAVSGIASAFYHPLGSSALALTFEGSSGYAMGINGAMGSLGRALYPSISTFLFAALYSNYFLSLLVLAAVSLAVTVWSLIAPEVEVRREEKKDDKGKSAVSTPMKVVAMLTVVSFARSLFTQGVSQYVGVILVKYFGYSFGQGLGNTITLFLLPAIIGQPFFGLMSDRAGRRLTLAVSTLGAVVSIVGFVLTGSIALLALFGFFTFSAFPLTLALTSDLVPRRSTGLANSLVWGLGTTGGGAIGPLVMGLLLAYMPLTTSVYVLSILGIISAALTAALPRPPKRSKVPLFG